MDRFIFYDLTIPYQNRAQALYDFDRTGLLFADCNDVVLLREKKYYDDDLLKYWQQVGLCPLEVKVDYVEGLQGYLNLDNITLLSEYLKSTYKINDVIPLETFVVPENIFILADSVGLQIDVPKGQFERFEPKSLFRKMAQKNDLPIPDGEVVNFSDENDFSTGLQRFFAQDYEEAIVRDDNGVAGLSSLRLKKEQYVERKDEVSNFLPPLDIAFNESNAERHGVIEEWFADVFLRPSVQLHFSRNGEVIVRGIHNQLVRHNLVTYAGCQSSHFLSDDCIQALLKKISKTVINLIEEKYYGDISFNAIVSESDGLLFTEINPRKVISSAAIKIAERLEIKNPYVMFEVTKEKWKGKLVSDIIGDLADTTYNPVTKSGILVSDVKFLPHAGSVMMFVTANSCGRVTELVKYAQDC